MTSWKPMSTAPKDGTDILATDGYKYAVVWFGDINSADSEFGTVAHTPEYGWLVSDGKNDPIWYRGWIYLTHWMPLPEPPK